MTDQQEPQYTGGYEPGDRVVVVSDSLDGSWEGAEGTVVKTYRQKGGIFAPERNVELVMLDDEDSGEWGDLSTPEAREKLCASYEENDEPWLADSDDYEFEGTS